MSSYDRLADFLSRHKSDRWDATFSDVERVIGRPLPPSANKYPAWWANQSGTGHSQTVGWQSVGWKTAALDLPLRRVRFIRERSRQNVDLPATSQSPFGIDRLWTQATALTGIHDRDEIVRLALEALISEQSVLQLAALGGSMPGFEAPARDRP